MVTWNEHELRAYELKTRRVPSRAQPQPDVCDVKKTRSDKGCKRPRHFQVCQQCGKTFQAANSFKRKFCSLKCASGKFAAQKSYTRGASGWVDVGGKRFFARSSWEANYGRFLQFQQDHGLIRNWQHEPCTFWFEGIKRGVCSYLPDFRIETNSGTIEFHEVKGWMDAKSLTKIKRMAKYHPAVTLVVIDQKRYEAISKTARFVVPNWTLAKRKNAP